MKTEQELRNVLHMLGREVKGDDGQLAESVHQAYSSLASVAAWALNDKSDLAASFEAFRVSLMDIQARLDGVNN